MLELQKEFGLGFLLPYFTEVHFPLCSVTNTKEQNNDIPMEEEIQGLERELLALSYILKVKPLDIKRAN